MAGVLINSHNEVLISNRRQNTHLAGLWEFPGGKLEPGESRLQGLSRELHEELGIKVAQAVALIRVRHRYPERNVLLDVWEITEYHNIAIGREGQPLQWVLPEQLHKYSLPPADEPIRKALLLPNYYVILDADHRSPKQLHEQIEINVRQNCSLFLLRSKMLSNRQYTNLAKNLIRFSRQLNVRLLLNSTAEDVVELGAAGLHLSSRAASCLNHCPVERDFILGVSCHHSNELALAQELDADFALLSPVKQTQSHPLATPMGWSQFSDLVDQINIPVYALGGLGFGDLDTARRYGAQGIAGISAFQ